MKKLPVAWALAAIAAGSAHAVDIVYSNEDFEAGTPNHTIDNTAAGTITQLQDGNLVNIAPATAFSGTDYVSGSTSRMGIVASGQPANLSPGGTIPTGRHAFFSTSANRSMTLASPMTLVADNVQSINIRFSYMLYGLGTTDFTHTLELAYSANGLFTDTVQIATFGFLPATPASTPGTHYPAVQDTWISASLSIASTNVTFTDTAKIRLNKMAPAIVEQIVFLDDIVITGIPAAAAAPFAATIAPAVNPNTGFDLRWTSQTGQTYSVLASTDLATPVDSWTVVQAGIAPTPPQNSYNVPADGPRRFYVIREIAP